VLREEGRQRHPIEVNAQPLKRTGTAGRRRNAQGLTEPIEWNDLPVMRRIATIGVYEADLDSFLAALRAADVALLLDVRQRRGVRGREYAWANAQRLQRALVDARIAYEHRKDLAPTTELRHLQYAEDDRRGVSKRSRRDLAPAYVERYRREILDHADLDSIVARMPNDATTALLCVERDPEACHRSLVAAELADAYDLPVVHLYP
jgi:uncharacterized protein (DUF488 family)